MVLLKSAKLHVLQTHDPDALTNFSYNFMDRRLVPTNYGDTSYRPRPLPFTIPTKSFVTEGDLNIPLSPVERSHWHYVLTSEARTSALCSNPVRHACLPCVCVYTSRDAGVTPTLTNVIVTSPLEITACRALSQYKHFPSW